MKKTEGREQTELSKTTVSKDKEDSIHESDISGGVSKLLIYIELDFLLHTINHLNTYFYTCNHVMFQRMQT